MKTMIYALIGLLGVTLGAPLAEAKDKHDRDHYRGRHYSSRDDRHYHSYSRNYSKRYYYRSARPYSYSYPRSYGYYDPYAGERYYYSRRPAITFSFGL